MKVKANAMAKEIAKTLKEYEGVTVDNMKNAVDKAAKKAVKDLKSTSPNRTGAYSKSWAAKRTKQSNAWAYEKTVFNKKHYRLTHLLEKGHRKVNGGMVAARPHIAKVEQEVIDDLVKEIKEGV